MYVMQSPPGAETVINGKKYVYFAGTGYFNLHGHPDMLKACCEGVKLYGIGSATSRTGYGDNPALLKVEEDAAAFFKAEDAVYYASGYLGFPIYAELLNDRFDLFILDEHAHYSVFAGTRQAGVEFITFNHLDPDDLSAKLKRHLKPGRKPLLVSDGIFPIFGEIAPVDCYCAELSHYDGWGLYIDDAHGVGILGANGRGTLEHFELTGDNIYFSGTLSKAFGGHGGVIPAKKELTDRIRAESHPYIGSSPVPAPIAHATAQGIEIVSRHPEMRTRLWRNVKILRAGLNKLGFEVGDSIVPIICLRFGKNGEMRRAQEELMKRGIVVAFVETYAGVGEEGALRIAVFSSHTDAMLEALLTELATIT